MHACSITNVSPSCKSSSYCGLTSKPPSPSLPPPTCTGSPRSILSTIIRWSITSPHVLVFQFPSPQERLQHNTTQHRRYTSTRAYIKCLIILAYYTVTRGKYVIVHVMRRHQIVKFELYWLLPVQISPVSSVGALPLWD